MGAKLQEDGTIELTIEREFKHPPEKVFMAWLVPEKLALWMGHSDEMQASNVKVDAVKGGSYSMEFPNENGSILKLSGVYHRIDKFTDLVFTWIWEPAMDESNPETLVLVNFSATDVGTKLSLVHKRFGSDHMRDCHAHGWEGTFDKLFRRLDQILTN